MSKKTRNRKKRKQAPAKRPTKQAVPDVLAWADNLSIKQGEMTPSQRVKFWGAYMKIARRVKWYTLRGIRHRVKAAWELFKALQERDNG